MAQPTSAARPKRPGEDFNRVQDNINKKPRFDYRNPSTLAADEPEEDIILDADVIGKSGAQLKRNAVNIDGYESDSDNDNFDARAAERERAKQDAGNSKDEEQDDMFADLEEADGDDDEDKAREGKKSKKDVRFLDQTEIEGQVMNSHSGGHVSSQLLKGQKGLEMQEREKEDSESSSGEEEDRDQLPEEMEDEFAAEVGAGGKKKHAPRLDAFNLKEEEEEGKYDESGNFVRKAVDPDAVNDSWLDGLTKKDMKRAREAQEKRDSDRRRKDAEDDAQLTSDILSTLISHLETGETPLEALQRLNKGKPAKAREAKVPKWKQKKQQQKMDIDEDTNGHSENRSRADPAETARRTAVDAITGSADALYSREQHEIYDTEREILMRQFKRETGEDWRLPERVKESVSKSDGPSLGKGSMWEYRWSDARDGGETHGPYDGTTMKAWNEAGYFGEGVEFRQVNGSDGGWSRVLDT